MSEEYYDSRSCGGSHAVGVSAFAIDRRPALLTAIVVGLIVSLLQAVTQLQDQTLSFVPKIIAMMVVMLYTLPWVLNEIVEYSQDLFQEIPLSL